METHVLLDVAERNVVGVCADLNRAHHAARASGLGLTRFAGHRGYAA
jgi:hypothetical protein